MTLAELNALDERSAENVLKPCCGSRRWAVEMSARRPFPDTDELHREGDLVWQALDKVDWFEAFASHPKIGETGAASEWSKREQTGMITADDGLRARLAQLNREYLERFGFIFIICATGKSAAEMLGSLEGRLENSAEKELQIAAHEQMKIAHLRLKKLILQ
jgi:OHCU decarboxylase